MELKITRTWFTSESTIGIVSINDIQQCYSLEPQTPVRDRKPHSIPPGVYSTMMYASPKHGYVCPLLQAVPGFEMVEIHIGNKPQDTEGCILVGKTHDLDWVGNSGLAFEQLMEKLPGHEIFTVRVEVKV